MAAFNKTTVILLLVACTMIITTEAINNWVRVGPCDQVCSRSDAEKDECCRAHGHAFHANCHGGMNCYRRHKIYTERKVAKGITPELKMYVVEETLKRTSVAEPMVMHFTPICMAICKLHFYSPVSDNRLVNPRTDEYEQKDWKPRPPTG